jgi:hypothetical protein
LEEEHGGDVVRRINEAMRGCAYDEHKVWHGCCGSGVKELWKNYKKSVGEDGGLDGGERREEKCKANDEAPAQDDDKPAQEDNRTEREKARRGGNMHIPIRP